MGLKVLQSPGSTSSRATNRVSKAAGYSEPRFGTWAQNSQNLALLNMKSLWGEPLVRLVKLQNHDDESETFLKQFWPLTPWATAAKESNPISSSLYLVGVAQTLAPTPSPSPPERVTFHVSTTKVPSASAPYLSATLCTRHSYPQGEGPHIVNRLFFRLSPTEPLGPEPVNNIIILHFM